MPRGRTRRLPALRNLELYHEHVCEDRPQLALAAHYRLSQPRVAQICRRVREWVDVSLQKTRPDSAAATANAQLRFHLAVMVRRMQLADAYGPFLDAFGGAAAVDTWHHLQIAADAGLLTPECCPPLPPRDMVAAARGMVRQLKGLARIAKRGPFARFAGPLTLGNLEQLKVPAPGTARAEEQATNQPTAI